MTQLSMSEVLSHQGKPTLKMILLSVLTLAIPAIVEQIMVTMVQFVDTAMVGSLGSIATASVGLTASTTWLINGVLSAAAVGFSVQVAQYIGAAEHQKAQNVVGQSLIFALLFGVLAGAAAFALSFVLPIWLGAEADIIQPSSRYFRIMACAVPFNCCVLTLSAIIRCAGMAKTSMYLNLAINALNVTFNFLFIYPTRTIVILGRSITMWGAGLGVAGAAYGSLTALVVVGVAFVIVIFKSRSPVKIGKGTNFGFTRACLSTTFRLGLPVVLERVSLSAAQIVITAVIASIGTAAVAANHLAITAESLSYLPAYGVAIAATTLVGQAIGAGRKDIAKQFSRVVTYMGIGIMTVGGVLLFIFARNLIGIFSTDPDVLALGTDILRIVALAQPFFAMSIVITGVLRGAGDTKGPFLVCLTTIWSVRITLSLVLVRIWGLQGVWMGMALELIVRGMLFMLRMCRGKWLDIQLFHQNDA